jgi:hypothetical protein
MGLDNFASRLAEEIWLTPEDLQAFSDAEIDLCGGLFSGHPGSFRGEMYDLLLLDITHVSPLRAWIPPETVHSIYLALLNCDPGTVLAYYQQVDADLEQEYRGQSLEMLTFEIQELRKFFRVCSERGLGLIGWG